MKQITILMGVFCALFAVSCHGTAGHDGHDAHADHQTGEQHEPEPAHADEIVLSADKARAAGVVVETVAAGDFRSVIPAGGVILPSTGDETSVVAPAPGVVSLRRPLVEGSAVGAGEALFTISSANLQDGDPAERAAVAYETAKRSMNAPGIWFGTALSPRRSSMRPAAVTKRPKSPTRRLRGPEPGRGLL